MEPLKCTAKCYRVVENEERDGEEEGWGGCSQRERNGMHHLLGAWSLNSPESKEKLTDWSAKEALDGSQKNNLE